MEPSQLLPSEQQGWVLPDTTLSQEKGIIQSIILMFGPFSNKLQDSWKHLSFVSPLPLLCCLHFTNLHLEHTLIGVVESVGDDGV